MKERRDTNDSEESNSTSSHCLSLYLQTKDTYRYFETKTNLSKKNIQPLLEYLIGAVWSFCIHQDLGGFRYRHQSSQSKPWAERGYSSISKVSYLMLSKDGEMTRVLSSWILWRIGSALNRDKTWCEHVLYWMNF